MKTESICCWLAGVVWIAQGFATVRAAEPATAQNTQQQVASPNAGQKWYVRDPRTGRLFLRELRTVQQTVQQIVQTEVPEPTAAPSAAQPRIQVPTARYDHASMGNQPLIRIPILAQQQVLRWPQPATRPVAQPSPWRSSLLPGILPNSSQSAYVAPLNITAPPSRTALRDSLQVGMPATVLR